MIGDIFQPTHLLLLLAVVLLVLGPKRLPEMARSLGRGFRDFKDAISGESNPTMPELDHQSFEPTPAAATRGSAQRPVTAAATGPVSTPASDPMEAADPELATEPQPEPVASQASESRAEGAA